MNEVEFGTQIDRLKAVYGDKSYPHDRVLMIWKKMKWRHPLALEGAIDHLIADNQYAPMLVKILEAVGSVERANPDWKIDPYKETRDKLRAYRIQAGSCHRCSNTGVFTALRKYQGLTPATMICLCSAGSLAKQLPDYRECRQPELHDPFYLIFEFDPNLHLKMDLYRDLYFENSTESQGTLAEIYYSKEIHMQPVYWTPPGWAPPPKIKHYIEPRDDADEIREEIERLAIETEDEIEEMKIKGEL